MSRLNKIIGNTCFAQSFTKFDESLYKTKEAILEFYESIPQNEYNHNPHRTKSGKIRRR